MTPGVGGFLTRTEVHRWHFNKDSKSHTILLPIQTWATSQAHASLFSNKKYISYPDNPPS